MNRTYKVSKYLPTDYECDSRMASYVLEIKYNNVDKECIEYELVDGGNVLVAPLRFCSRGFFEDYEGTAHYVFQSDNFSINTTSPKVLVTLQDLVCCHMTNNWNCSMRDLEIYYNLYLSYKGIITKAELLGIVDRILEG